MGRPLDEVLSTINVEPRSILLAFCLSERYARREEVREGLIRLIGESPYASPRRMVDATLEALFQDRLIKKLTGAGEQRYALSDLGLAAQPVAAYALTTAVDGRRSLYSVLGPTTSGEHGGPADRFKLVLALSAEPRSQADLGRATGISAEQIHNYLKTLSGIGIVDCRMRSNGERVDQRYSWVPGRNPSRIPEMEGRTGAVGAVVAALRSSGPLTVRGIANETGYSLATAKRIITHLRARGFITGDYDASNRAPAHLTELGERFQTRFKDVATYWTRRTGPVVEEWERVRGESGLQRDVAAKAMALYVGSSPLFSIARPRPAQERVFAAVNGLPMTKEDVAETLGLPWKSVYRHLVALAQEGRLSTAPHPEDSRKLTYMRAQP